MLSLCPALSIISYFRDLAGVQIPVTDDDSEEQPQVDETAQGNQSDLDRYGETHHECTCMLI